MSHVNSRMKAKFKAVEREIRSFNYPTDSNGNPLKPSEVFGENVFNVFNEAGIPDAIKKEIKKVSREGGQLSRESAEVVAQAVMDWATKKGATHFCHWFQPLTGSTAEKHDSFIDFDKVTGAPIERLSVSSLLHGEPDASSFPNGGSRSTFEARGYTAWDLTSPMFLMEGTTGKTLTIPTAFISYTGEALDIKTPLLRSINQLDKVMTKFLGLIGEEADHVVATAGCEQEYFLIDKAMYNHRPDLVMTNRTVLGSLCSKNQQLSDHYFGSINDRVLAFMEELDYELYRLGIPSKTRHNEVAPGQFEIAPIFADGNVAADQNQIIMDVIGTVADRHGFVDTLHEKPFAGVNGSGKHLNWSMQASNGLNLLDPGKEPHQNARFLTVVASVMEAVNRHATILRAAIGSAGNDFRLGANEAPPSIISMFIGDTLEKIFNSLAKDESPKAFEEVMIEMGANQLVNLAKDNTDRNRTSPFAFTGNKFEFRAVGSSAPVGFPMAMLNAAVANVFTEVNQKLEALLGEGKSVDEALITITKEWIKNSYHVVFNGDGYSDEWVKEAEKRGLPNLKNTPVALQNLVNPEQVKFLVETGVMSENELKTRYNVLIEQYEMLRDIEFSVQEELVQQHVIPSALAYKKDLTEVIKSQKDIGIEASVEVEILKRVNFASSSLYSAVTNLAGVMSSLGDDAAANAQKMADELLPLSEEVAKHSNELENIVPDHYWTLPKFYEMLFLR